jgi:hypothetical protein
VSIEANGVGVGAKGAGHRQTEAEEFGGSFQFMGADSFRHLTTAFAEDTSADARKCLMAGGLGLATALPAQGRRRNDI